MDLLNKSVKIQTIELMFITQQPTGLTADNYFYTLLPDLILV